MAQIITAVQEKGGTGKTTLVCTLASLFDLDDARVLLVDTDPQDGSSNWWVEKEETPESLSCIRHTDEETFFDLLEKATQEFDIILVDTAGYKSAIAQYAIQSSDLILIPTKAEELSLAGALRTLKHVENTTRNLRHASQKRLVLTDFDKSTTISTQLKDYLSSQGYPLLRSPLPHLTGFKEMFSSGGAPKGRAFTAARSLLASLQIDKLIPFYNVEG